MQQQEETAMTRALQIETQILGILRRSRKAALALAPLLLATMAVAQLSQAQAQTQTETFTVLYTFSGLSDGKSPVGGLLEDSGGNFYGLTQQGGDPVCECGTIYEYTAAGNFSVFHIFIGAPSDGATPTGGLAYWQDYFYGATAAGGVANSGTVYTISDRDTGYDMLHSFSGADGTSPEGRVTLDVKTNIYGAAAYGGNLNCSNGLGGAPGCGTIYKVTLAGNLTVLHTFSGGADGATPYELDGLIRDSAGNLYGTTYAGGDPACQPQGVSLPQGCGTIFKLDTAGTNTVLYNFTGTPADGCATCADGIGPIGGLIKGQAGSYFGTTTLGGDVACNSAGLGCGTFFELSSTNAETLVHTFTGGSSPELLSIAYGVTVNGGTFGYGAVFKMNTAGIVTVLHNFTGGADGAFPQAGLLRDPAGNLYGTTSAGGNLSCSNTLPSGCGTLFKISTVSTKADDRANQ
jgi:uncharacterized repeat protein (TIGR03803 family)